MNKFNYEIEALREIIEKLKEGEIYEIDKEFIENAAEFFKRSYWDTLADCLSSFIKVMKNGYNITLTFVPSKNKYIMEKHEPNTKFTNDFL